MASLADQTPEGKSIVELADASTALELEAPAAPTFVEFTAQTRMSGIDLPDGARIRKGAADTDRQGRRERRRDDSRGLPGDRRRDRLAGRDAAGRRRTTGSSASSSSRTSSSRHPRAVRPAAPDGPARRDGHRRQPAHGQGDRRGGRRRRLHRPGHPRGQARLHPQGAGRAASSSP